MRSGAGAKETERERRRNSEAWLRNDEVPFKFGFSFSAPRQNLLFWLHDLASPASQMAG